MTLINGKILESVSKKKTDLFRLIFFHQSRQGYSPMRLSLETKRVIKLRLIMSNLKLYLYSFDWTPFTQFS